jgi:hypothetical protein
MAECWLKTNARALRLGMLIPAAHGAVGLVIALGVGQQEPSPVVQTLGACVAGLSLIAVLYLAREIRRPRLAYEDGSLLVNIRRGSPARVPIDVVECFFLGQSPSMLPGRKYERTETSAVVVRLAERATDWAAQEVVPALGKWCNGYITIRGTWCEPLNIQVVNELNRRLAEVTSQSKHSGAAT